MLNLLQKVTSPILVRKSILIDIETKLKHFVSVMIARLPLMHCLILVTKFSFLAVMVTKGIVYFASVDLEFGILFFVTFMPTVANS